MKRKLLIIISVGVIFGLLSGCSQVEDILSKVNELLDDELAVNEESEENEAVENVQDEENNNNNTNENTDNQEENTTDQTADESISDLPFDERLISQGYDIKTLPNGFPFRVPYHWVLVEDNLGDANAENYESKFCFDLPLDIQEVASYFDFFDDINQEFHGEDEDIIHTTTYRSDNGYPIDGTMEYMLDDHNNTCVTVTVLFGEESGEHYGGDPDEMISEEELAEERAGMESEPTVNEDRKRLLPDRYEEAKKLILDDHEMEARHVDLNEILSIEEKIRNNEMEMYYLSNGYPRIFPYEWYLMNPEDEPGSFPGTFCTDTPLNDATLKHLDMLADYNANIDYLDPSDSLRPNVVTEVGFELNDEHGTGSWKGVSHFFISPQDEGAYPLHRCVSVDMWFSDEILD